MHSRLLCCALWGAVCLPLALLAHDPHDPMVTVAVSPNYAQDQTVIAASDTLSVKAGVYLLLKSTSGGVNWSVVQGLPNNTRVASITFSPAYAQDQTIFLAGAGGLFVSTNQGSSWSTLLKSPLLNLALSPNFANDNTMLVVSAQQTLLESTNRGQTWTSITLPVLSGSGPTVIAISPNFGTDSTLLLGSNANGIYKSGNGGGSWVAATSGITSSVTGLVFSPSFSTDQTAFASTLGSGVLVSTTAGNSWVSANSGITDQLVTSVSLSPTYFQDSTLWITSAVAGVYRSTTQGQSWTLMSPVSRALSPLTCTHYLALSLAGGGSSPSMFMATFEGLWNSNNGAVTWGYIDSLPTRLIRHINISPNFTQDHTVFASTYGGGNLWSTSAGNSWIFRNTGMQRSYTDASAISPNFAVDGTAFSSNEEGLQRTVNRGSSWQLMSGLLLPSYPRALAVSPNYAQDSTVLIGLSASTTPPCGIPDSSNTGVFLSTDGGNTWQPTSLTGVTGINSIVISPAFATDRTAYAASPNTGLYESTDGGKTWMALTAPAKTLAIVALSPNFTNDGTVVASGVNTGIFQSTTRGATWSTLSQTNNLRVLDLQVSPNYVMDQSFFAGTLQKGLLKFTKGGTSMTQITGFPDQFVSAIGISPNFATDYTLFAAGYHGIYRSTNGGTTWTNLSAPARIEESQNVTGILQEPPIITFSGPWSFITPSTTASSEAYAVSSTTQNSIVLNFMGTGVAWVGQIGPQQGSATVQIDQQTPSTVSLNASKDQYQYQVWQQQGLLCGLHTLVITGTPQSGQAVSLDAFNVWVNNCPLQ